MIGQIVPIQL